MKSKPQDKAFRFICIPSAAGPLIVPYRLERSPRIKRMHLQIHGPQCVVLKLPPWQSEAQGARFLQQQGEWIRRTLAAQPRVPLLREHLARHPRLSLNGRWYRLEMDFHRDGSRYQVADGDCRVRISLHPRLCVEQQLVGVLRAIAEDHLPPRLLAWAAKIGVKVHGVAVRDQRCRWGSCSETGGISLNWRLILIAPRLQDHVMLHELAHLRHFNHSGAFHRLLAQLDPRAARHSRQLDHEATRVIALGRLPE